MILSRNEIKPNKRKVDNLHTKKGKEKFINFDIKRRDIKIYFNLVHY